MAYVEPNVAVFPTLHMPSHSEQHTTVYTNTHVHTLAH